MKRALSLFIAMTMLLTGVLSPTFDSKTGLGVTTSAADTWEWWFNSDVGQLHIYGTGAVTGQFDGWGFFVQPWAAHRDDITSIYIDEGITSIPNAAFRNCENATWVMIEKDVESIGEGAFMFCDSLEAFHGSTLNAAYSVVDGVLFNKDQTTLVTYPLGKPDSSYTIPNTVNRLGKYAFHYVGAQLTQITVPNSVEHIEKFGLSIEGVTEIIIPDSVKTIGSEAFFGSDALEKVTIGSGVTNMGQAVFEFCDNLKSVTFKSPTPPVVEYGGNIGGSGYTIYVPSGSEAAYTAALKFSEYQTVNIVEGAVIFVGHNNGDVNYTQVYEAYDEAGIDYRDPFVATVLPGAERITFRAFYHSGLISVTLPDTLKTIGDSAFEDCQSLTEITIPAGVTDIAGFAFNDCIGLNSVTFRGATPPTIGDDAFRNCNSLTTIYVPFGAKAAYQAVSQLSGYNIIEIGAPAPTPIVVEHTNGRVGEENVNAALQAAGITRDDPFDVTFATGVTAITAGAFMNCRALEMVQLPLTVTTLEDHSFSGCTSLNFITFTSMTPPEIGAYVFPANLNTINVPAAAKSAYETLLRSRGYNGDVVGYGGNPACTHDIRSPLDCRQCANCSARNLGKKCSAQNPCAFHANPIVTPNVMLGDVDGDKKITISDALEILKNLAGMSSKIEKGKDTFLAADIDGDGKITISDALEVLKKLAGMSNKIDNP